MFKHEGLGNATGSPANGIRGMQGGPYQQSPSIYGSGSAPSRLPSEIQGPGGPRENCIS